MSVKLVAAFWPRHEVGLLFYGPLDATQTYRLTTQRWAANPGDVLAEGEVTLCDSTHKAIEHPIHAAFGAQVYLWLGTERYRLTVGRTSIFPPEADVVDVPPPPKPPAKRAARSAERTEQ